MAATRAVHEILTVRRSAPPFVELGERHEPISGCMMRQL
jgi:hypothetical protein